MNSKNKQNHSLVVYYAEDAAVRAVANAVARERGCDLLGVRTAMGYPASRSVAVARRIWELNWGVVGGLSEPAEAVSAVTKADRIVLVASAWGERLAAPLAAFLGRHRLSGKAVQLLVDGPIDSVPTSLVEDVLSRTDARVSVVSRTDRTVLRAA